MMFSLLTLLKNKSLMVGAVSTTIILAIVGFMAGVIKILSTKNYKKQGRINQLKDKMKIMSIDNMRDLSVQRFKLIQEQKFKKLKKSIKDTLGKDFYKKW